MDIAIIGSLGPCPLAKLMVTGQSEDLVICNPTFKSAFLLVKLQIWAEKQNRNKIKLCDPIRKKQLETNESLSDQLEKPQKCQSLLVLLT